MVELPKITVAQVQQRATAQSFARGQSYANQEAIFNTVRRGTELEGLSEGSDVVPYRVHAVLDKNRITTASCTCLYDWGGDCKHIVALLLAYIRTPEGFVERKPVEEMLAEQTKDDLILLIQEMIERYPNLEMLINRPTPGKSAISAPVDVSSYRQELSQVMGHYGGWGDRSAERTVRSVVKSAALFAGKGDWVTARAIYSAVLDECLEDAAMFDDEGEFIWQLSGAVEGLIECLGRSEIAGKDAERRAAIDSLLYAYIWDVDFGGVGLSDDVPDTILKHAPQDELVAVRERIRTALKEKLAAKHGEWGAERYGRFLTQLDALDADPEAVLTRLQEYGLQRLVFEKLLEMARVGDAIEIVEKHLTASYDRYLAVNALAEAGHPEDAIRLTKETLEEDYDRRLTKWLLDQYQARGNREAHLQLLRERMAADPQVEYFAALQRVAEDLGRWETIRPEITQWLKKDEEHHGLLTRVYLYEEDWDAAWETLERILARQPDSPFDWVRYAGYSLEMEVAERSRLARPDKAIPIYVKHAEAQISRRQRKYYQVAASNLTIVRHLYAQIGETDVWQELIARMRKEYERLPALQDELTKASL